MAIAFISKVDEQKNHKLDEQKNQIAQQQTGYNVLSPGTCPIYTPIQTDLVLRPAA